MFENLILYDFLRLAVFTIFFIHIILSDFREKKIYNKDLYKMGALGVILFLLGLKFDLIPSLLTNFFLALMLGICLWKLGVWSAGDGKLFAICTLYLPYKLYLPFFYAQTILINVFVLAFLLWLIPLIFKTKRSDKISIFKASFMPKNIFSLFLVIFGIFYFIAKLVYLIDFGLHTSGYIISLAVAFLIFGFLKKKYSSHMTYVFLAFAAARVFFDTSFLSFDGGLKLMLTVFALLFAGFLGDLSMHISYTEKKHSKLMEGDIPIGLILRKNKTKDLEELLKTKFKDADIILNKGFSKDDLVIARKIKDVDGFIVKKTICFAPFLFISTILAVFLGCDVLLYLISIFYGWFYG